MGLEIERKFLVRNDSWKTQAVSKKRLCQKYIPLGERVSGVGRIRIAGEEAFLTFKSAQKGISRAEFEYSIPPADALVMMKMFCPGHAVDKFRYLVPFAGHTWEVDEFLGVHQGLVIAEIELSSPEESFEKPDWVGEEVSGDYHYRNSYLAEHA